MRFILNSAVLSTPGSYNYRLIAKQEAAAWIQKGNFVSRVGYPATADHIKSISGVRPGVNREPTHMETGDEALIVRLKYRMTSPGEKTSYKPSPNDWEYGILGKTGGNDEEWK